MTIDFFSNIPESDIYLLQDLGRRYAFDILCSDNSERYFVELLQMCNVMDGDKNKF